MCGTAAEVVFGIDIWLDMRSLKFKVFFLFLGESRSMKLVVLYQLRVCVDEVGLVFDVGTKPLLETKTLALDSA